MRLVVTIYICAWSSLHQSGAGSLSVVVAHLHGIVHGIVHGTVHGIVHGHRTSQPRHGCGSPLAKLDSGVGAREEDNARVEDRALPAAGRVAAKVG